MVILVDLCLPCIVWPVIRIPLAGPIRIDSDDSEGPNLTTLCDGCQRTVVTACKEPKYSSPDVISQSKALIWENTGRLTMVRVANRMGVHIFKLRRVSDRVNWRFGFCHAHSYGANLRDHGGIVVA